jgi:hypothetical protein
MHSASAALLIFTDPWGSMIMVNMVAGAGVDTEASIW